MHIIYSGNGERTERTSASKIGHERYERVEFVAYFTKAVLETISTLRQQNKEDIHLVINENKQFLQAY